MLGEKIIGNADNLSRTLQDETISAAEGQEVVASTKATMQRMRTDTDTELFWQLVETEAVMHNVGDSALPRKRKAPARFDTETASPEFHETAESMYRAMYFEALDLAVTCIVDQPGFLIYRRFQNVLEKSVQGKDCEEDINFVTEFYGNDFDSYNLRVQLNLMSTVLPNSDGSNMHMLLQKVKRFTTSQKSLINEVMKLVQLILVLPSTNTMSERSFSALRRLKNYLRSSMSQQRLNHVALLNIHKSFTDN